MIQEKLQINVDASSLSKSACTLAWYRTIVQGYREPRMSAAIVYGIAVHKFIDTMMRTSGEFGQSHLQALTSFRIPKIPNRKQSYLEDENHLITTCNWVWLCVIKEEKSFDILKLANGEPAIELNFSIPYYEDDTIVVNLCGTIDKIGKFKSGIFAIGDWKTSSTHDPEVHLDRYTMAAQLRVYTLAMRLMSRHFPDSLLGKIGAEPLGAFIDGLYLRPKPNDNEFHRGDVMRFDDADMEMFESNLNNRIISLSRAIANNTWHNKEGIVNGACSQAYGKCAFWGVCSRPEPHLVEAMLKRDFVQRPYNPLNFRD